MTKEKIIEVCKRLFCEKGYQKTTFAEICDISHVNPGTITYHHKSKKNIASVLYNEVMEVFYRRTEELFPHEDDLQQVMIAAGMHQKLLYQNPVYRRFSAEFSSECIHNDRLVDYTNRATKAYQITKERVGKKKAAFLFTAFKGMDGFIESYIDDHINELSFEEIFEFIAALYYQFVDSSELKERIGRALHSLSILDIIFDRFKIAITIRPS